MAQVTILNQSLIKGDTNVLYLKETNRIKIEGTNEMTRKIFWVYFGGAVN